MNIKYRRLRPQNLSSLRSTAMKIGIKSIVSINPKANGDYAPALRAAMETVQGFLIVMPEGTELDYCRLLHQVWALTYQDSNQYAIVLPDGSEDIDRMWEVIAQNNMGAIVES